MRLGSESQLAQQETLKFYGNRRKINPEGSGVLVNPENMQFYKVG